jgi:hypothetical protein
MIHFPLHNIRKSIDGIWDQLYTIETRTIPGSADNYIIELIEVPDDGSINQKPVIDGFTETTTYPPASGEYYINYHTGYIAFNENNAGNVIDIKYYAKGSLVEVQDINYLYDKLTGLEQLYTISPTPPSSTDIGYQWFNTNNNINYIYDGLRQKWLSIQRMNISFGKKGLTNNQYLYFYGGVITSNINSSRMIRNACIVSMSVQFSDIGTGTFYILKNNNNTTLTSIDVINDYGNGDESINIDINEGDVIKCYFDSSFSNVKDPIITLEIAWRY